MIETEPLVQSAIRVLDENISTFKSKRSLTNTFHIVFYDDDNLVSVEKMEDSNIQDCFARLRNLKNQINFAIIIPPYLECDTKGHAYFYTNFVIYPTFLKKNAFSFCQAFSLNARRNQEFNFDWFCKTIQKEVDIICQIPCLIVFGINGELHRDVATGNVVEQMKVFIKQYEHKVVILSDVFELVVKDTLKEANKIIGKHCVLDKEKS